MNLTLRFIDLFAGMGGIRLGFEQACKDANIDTECVLTSELKPYAIQTLTANFEDHNFRGDVSQIASEDIPDFDFLFGGFPCQPFSSGGKRHGFADTRGTLFFEVERIIRDKSPTGFILENVEGLVRHDLVDKNSNIGNTLSTILRKLSEELGYHVSWSVLNSADFGVPQARKRVFIVGSKSKLIPLDQFPTQRSILSDILESGLPTMKSKMVDKLLTNYSIRDLYGKSIKDKRGGKNNIHSWDIGLKGQCSVDQRVLLNSLFKQRRKKHWAKEIGIDWMDGMPLTLNQISTFFSPTGEVELQELLDDLVTKGYLKYEHPKKLVVEMTSNGKVSNREYDTTKDKGYNIVTGKLSFEISKILDPNEISPTLVATDMSRVAVADGSGLRRLSITEGLRLFGYPESFKMPEKETHRNDLLGNTVVVPVVKAIADRLLAILYLKSDYLVEVETDEVHQSQLELPLEIHNPNR